MAFAEFSAPSRIQWPQIVDLLRSFPKQAQLALGMGGVIWATVAGVVGLLCCAVSFAVVALSLQATEIDYRQQHQAEIQALDEDDRLLLRTIMVLRSGQLKSTDEFPARKAWARLEASLTSICNNPDASAANRERVRRLCDVNAATFARIGPAIEAFDPPRRLLDMSVVRDLLTLRDEINNLRAAVARDADALVRRMAGDYNTALLVLTLSTSGFVAAGLILILLVGRTSVDYHRQWQEAREAHDMLRETIDALPAGVVVYDTDERLVMFNSVAADVTSALQQPNVIGKTYEEMARETGRRLEAAGMGPQPVEEWVARFRGKRTQRTRQTADGRWFDWSERSTLSGLTVGLRVDVTEVKKHEEALERARGEYQSLVDSLADVSYTLDVESGLYTFISASCADLFGVPAEKIVGTHFLNYIAPESREQVGGTTTRAHQPDDPGTFSRFCLKTAGGQVRHVEVRARRRIDPNGRLVSSGVIRDVEERVELERQLELETQRLRSVVESGGALIVLADREFKVVMVNSGFTAMTGRTEADVIGRPLHEVIDCPIGGGVAEPTQFAVKLHDPRGRKHLIAVTATPVAGNEGRLDSIVLIGVDDTERQLAEIRLFDSARLATLGEMATGMAHEINQPLAVIRMAADSLIEELETPEAAALPIDLAEFIKGKLVRISSQTERAAGLVNELRAVARKPTNDALPFDVAEAVRVANNLLYEQLKAARIEFTVDPPPTGVMVQGEASRLQQVIINLALNARDALLDDTGRPSTGTLGHIALRVATTPAGDAVLTLDDDGPGIPTHVLPRLFEPFFTTKPTGKGTGLGLSISYDIVKRMGGEITVKSRAIVTP